MSINHIYYVFTSFHARGGDYVNLAHIRALNKLGFNASALFIGTDYSAFEQALSSFSDIPIARLTDGLIGDKNNIFVSNELYRFMFDGAINFIPENIILHNQLPWATFEIFDSTNELNAHPFKYILTPSDYATNTLLDMGINKSIHTIYPAIPDYFYNAEKSKETIKIAYSSRKRDIEFKTLLFYIRSFYSGTKPISIVDLNYLSREEVAKVMRESAIYLSMAKQESLGLMALEAMACGCHVVGFTGYPDNAKQNLLNSENGDWVNEGDYCTFAKKVCAAIDLFESNLPNKKVENGLKLITEKFRQTHFEQAIYQFYTSL